MAVEYAAEGLREVYPEEGPGIASRARPDLLLMAVMVVLALASGLLFNQVFLQSFRKAETGIACRCAEWPASPVSGRLTALSSSAFDIAVRDETRAFMSTRDPLFVPANINGEMFSAGTAKARSRRGGLRHEHPRRGRADVTCIGSA